MSLHNKLSQKMVVLEIKEKRLDLQRDSHGQTYSGSLEIKNKHSSEVAIKIKSNYPQYYSVKPVSSLLSTNQVLNLSVKMHVNALKANTSSHKLQVLAYIVEDSEKQRLQDQAAIDGLFKGDYLQKCQKKVLDIHVAQIDKLDMSQIQEVNETQDENARGSLQFQGNFNQQIGSRDSLDRRSTEQLNQQIQLPSKKQYYGMQTTDMEYRYNILKQRLEEQEAIQLKIQKEIQQYEQKSKEVSQQTIKSKKNLDYLMLLIYFLAGVMICLFLKSQNILFFAKK